MKTPGVCNCPFDQSDGGAECPGLLDEGPGGVVGDGDVNHHIVKRPVGGGGTSGVACRWQTELCRPKFDVAGNRQRHSPSLEGSGRVLGLILDPHIASESSGADHWRRPLAEGRGGRPGLGGEHLGKSKLTRPSVEYLVEGGHVLVVQAVPHEEGAAANVADGLKPVCGVVVSAVATFEMGEEGFQGEAR